MPTLRDTFDPRVSDVSLEDIENYKAQNMGSLRRGYTSGSIGTDANAAAAHLAGLRAAGKHAEADQVAQQLQGLLYRQQMYAPDVGRIEDVGSLSDLGSYTLSNVGQLGASMQDPMAASIGLNAASKAAGFIPHPVAQGVSKALALAAPAAAWGINSNQLKGELVNDAMRDPELMKRTSWQDLNNNANVYGAAAGVLDTVLPGIVGRQVAGKTGLGALGVKGFGKKFLLGNGGEAATELAQEVGSKYTQGLMNPNRDTSGDASDYLNTVVGTFLGAAPHSALGAGMETAHERLHNTAEMLGKKAGDTADLATGAVTQATDSGKSMLGKALNLFGKGQKEAAGTDLGGAPKGQGDATERFTLSPEEIATLTNEVGVDPHDPSYDDAFRESDRKRVEYLGNKLAELHDTDPKAAELFDRAYADGISPVEQSRVFDQATQYLLQKAETERLAAKGQALQDGLGALGQAVGSIAKNVASGVAKGAMAVGKGVIEGASKKNLQSDDGDGYTFAKWQAHRDASASKPLAEAASYSRAVRFSQDQAAAVDLAAKYAADNVARKYAGMNGLRTLAKHTIYELADAAREWNTQSSKRVVTTGAEKNARLNRIASTLNRMYGQDDALSTVDTLGDLMGKRIGKKDALQYIKDQIVQLNTPAGKQLAAAQRQQLASTLTSLVPANRQSVLLDKGINLRGQDGHRMLELLEDLADGTAKPDLRQKLNTLFGAATVNKMLQTLNGHDIAAGKKEGTKEAPMFASDGEGESLTDSLNVTEDGEVDDYVKRMGDKQVARGSGPKLFGYRNTRTLRNSAEFKGNAFAAPAVSGEAMRKWHEDKAAALAEGREAPPDPRDVAAAKRPTLFSATDTLSNGKNAIEDRIAHMRKHAGAQWSVAARKASDLLADAGATDGSRIALYRDYLRKSMASTKATVEQRAKWGEELKTLGRVLSDYREGRMDASSNAADRGEEFSAENRDDTSSSGIHSLRKKRMDAARTSREADIYAKESVRGQFSSTAAERRAALSRADKYFSSRYVVVAEQMTNRDPESITAGEITTMSAAGAKLMDFARKASSQAQAAVNKGTGSVQAVKEARREENATIDAANILEFEGKDGKPVYIKAGDLVRWVRQQTEGGSTDDLSRSSADMAYLNDLMTGISSVIASGSVKSALPGKRNAFGQLEMFTDAEGLKAAPQSLRLATMTVGNMQYAKEKRTEISKRKPVQEKRAYMPGDARQIDGYQEEVAEDQARGEEFFVADALDGTEEVRRLDPQDYAALTPSERGELNNLAGEYRKATTDEVRNDIRRRQNEFLENLALRKDGARYSTAATSAPKTQVRIDDDVRKTTSSPRGVGPAQGEGVKDPAPYGDRRAIYSKDAKEAKQIPANRRMRHADGSKRFILVGFDENGDDVWGEMSDDEITPMDFFPKEKSGAVPDDFADAQFRNSIEGFDPSKAIGGTEYKMSAEGQAKVRGEAIRAKLIPNPGQKSSGLTQTQKEGLNNIVARIHAAYAPERPMTKDAAAALEKSSGTGPGMRTNPAVRAAKAGLVGGWHYLFPAAYALRSDFLNLGSDAPTALTEALQTLRGQVNRALLDSDAPLGRKVAVARLMAPAAAASKITEKNIQSILEKNSPPRDESLGYFDLSTKAAAPEVAAPQAPKSQPSQSGAERKLNAQTANSTPASPEQQAAAREWVRKTLGPQIKVDFEDITGYSGEFIEADNAIKISTTAAAGVMQTAYHEAMHALFARLAQNPKAQQVLSSIADNRMILDRLLAMLHKYPAAQAQLTDGEERLAYAFQFWAAGKLRLPVGPAKGFFQNLRKFFRRVAGRVSDAEKAADIFQAFSEGKLSDPSTAGKVLNDIMSQGTWTKEGLKKLDGMVQQAVRLAVPAEEVLLRSPSKAAQALAREFHTNPGDEDAAGHAEGMLNAQRTMTTKQMNTFANAVAGLDDNDLANVAKLMQNKTPLAEIPYAPYRQAVKKIRAQLAEFHTYMLGSGMEIGKVNEDYFPRTWSLQKLITNGDAFVKMLTDNYQGRLQEIVDASKNRGKDITTDDAAHEILSYLVRQNGVASKAAVEREDGVLAPYFASGEKREFAWIDTAHSEQWQTKNLVSIMSGYIHQGVRTAEYTHRFGRKGELLDGQLRQINAELVDHARAQVAAGEFKTQADADTWVERQMRNIREATGGMEGSLGKDISPGMRKFNSWMMVYQNLRLLPLTLFASVVDPLGMVARGATTGEAYETFLRGMREVFQGWADMFRDAPAARQKDKWTMLAEEIGALDAVMLSHHVSEEYSSTYLAAGAKKINDTLFKVNGMEAWNRGVRAGAVRSAVRFIAYHKSLPNQHSERWLKELNLTPDKIHLNEDGDLITDVDQLMSESGLPKPEATRQIEALHSAINRWVLGAILTPNAAQRPGWASDPHYSLIFHLKQFSYSFQQTLIKRAVRELNYGNLAPIASFAAYVPVMIASDIVKGLIVGGGQLPEYMRGYNAGDWVKHGLERSGALGIAGIGVDATHDMFSILGPSAEQAVDAITQPIASTTLRALPLNPLFSHLGG